MPITPSGQRLELEQLPRQDYIVGDPEDLVHLDWSSEWQPTELGPPSVRPAEPSDFERADSAVADERLP